MMNRQRFIGAAVLAATVLVLPATALADCGSDCQLDPPSKLGIPTIRVESGLQEIFQVVSLIAGILSVVFLIIGGIRYATSSGNSQRIEGAKNTILYAVIGLIVSLLASAIIAFALSRGPN